MIKTRRSARCSGNRRTLRRPAAGLAAVFPRADQPGRPEQVGGLLRRTQQRFVETDVVDIGAYRLAHRVDAAHPGVVEVGDLILEAIEQNRPEGRHDRVGIGDNQLAGNFPRLQPPSDQQRPLVGRRRAAIGRRRDGQQRIAAGERCEALLQGRQLGAIDHRA